MRAFLWLRKNAYQFLHAFHVPEPQKPMLVEDEPETTVVLPGAESPVPLPPPAPKAEAGLRTFNFGTSPVRVVMKDGEPWWMAKDVIAVLEIGNVTDAMSRLDPDEKGTFDSIEGGPSRNIVSESGLYSLVLGSRKPEAKVFKR